jgi:predicted  nucleic acid-binding Zn-ribbon protein
VQRRINELNQRVQSLQGEVSDLEKQRSSLRSSMIYGDPNRAQQNEEFSRLGRQIDAKNLELSAARNELSDALDRANKTTVLK